MRKFVTRNAFTHSHICDKIPPLGLEPSTLSPLTQMITQLTKQYAEKRPAIFTDSKRNGGLEILEFRNPKTKKIKGG